MESLALMAVPFAFPLSSVIDVVINWYYGPTFMQLSSGTMVSKFIQLYAKCKTFIGCLVLYKNYNCTKIAILLDTNVSLLDWMQS